jgi:peptide deformylase
VLTGGRNGPSTQKQGMVVAITQIYDVQRERRMRRMKSGSTQSVDWRAYELKESTEIEDLAKGMLQVMYAAEGVGLATPQVGVNKRLVVYNTSGDSKKWLEETILVNPEIIEYSDAKDAEIEGCLSFPDMNGEVTRSKWIKVQAMKGYPLVGRRFRSNHDSFL